MKMKYFYYLMIMLFLLVISSGIASAANQTSDALQIDDDSSDLTLDNGINEDLSNSIADEISSKDSKDLSEEIIGVSKDSQDSKLSSKSFSDIQKKIDNAKEKGTVSISGKYSATSNKNITITKSITLKGSNNAVLDFKKLSPLIVVKKSCTLTIENITFTNFKNKYSDKYGNDVVSLITKGASKLSVNLILKNCKFTDNQGSLIHVSKLTANNCNFNNNEANSDVIYSNYGNIKNSKFINNLGVDNGVICSKNKFTCDNCVFQKNGAFESNIYVIFSNDCNIKNSKFINNKGNGYGAVYSKNKVTCDNCVFQKNEALDYNAHGGAISAKTVNCNNCQFTSNWAYSEGGAIFAKTVNCNNCQFTKNKADQRAGSAISSDKVICKKCTFKENEKTGSAIYSYNKVNCQSCKFVKNSGGAIFACGDVTCKGCSFVKNSHKDNAGAVYCEAKVTCKSCSFIKNKANRFGAIYSKTSILNNCKFKKNKKGAIFGNKIIINSKKRFKNALLDNSLKKLPMSFKMKVSPRVIRYDSGKKIKIKVTYNKKPAHWRLIELYLLNFKSKKIVHNFVLNSKGIDYLYSNYVKAGKYIVKLKTPYNLPNIKIPIKIAKAKTIVKAPEVTNKFHKSKFFKVTVKNKVTKKVVSKIKVKIKVFTGKKSKIYKIKTNKKGTAWLNTEELSKGSHKVVISSADRSYKISAKSLITIK